jgi:hypothetical protein
MSSPLKTMHANVAELAGANRLEASGAKAFGKFT